MMLPVFFLSVLIFGFLFYASYNISSGVYVKTYCRKKTEKKEVALTFDDGPAGENTAKVLDILKQYGVEAAFFCIGSNVDHNPEQLLRMRDEGHLIGNHSYSHKGTFPLFSVAKMVADIKKGEEAITNVTGNAVRFFRPPFGVTNPLIKKALKKFNYKVIGWSIRSFDTAEKDADIVVKRVLRQIHPGAVILLHDRLPLSGDILAKILIYLSDNGYSVKRVDKLFNIN